MSHIRNRVKAVWVLFICLSFWILSGSGCVGREHVKKDAGPAAEHSTPKTITDIGMSRDSKSVHILIDGNRLLTYTSIKQPFPKAVVLYFPETNIEDDIIPDVIQNDVIAGVNASGLKENEQTARIEVLLKKDCVYQVSREGKGLKLSFEETDTGLLAETVGQTPVTDVPQKRSGTPNKLKAIATEQTDNGLKVVVSADAPIENYKSFVIESSEGKSARIVYDMYQLKSPFPGERKISVKSPEIEQIRHYGEGTEFRLVLDTTDQYLNNYSERSVPDGLEILIQKAAVEEASTETESASSALDTLLSQPDEPVADSMTATPAWINRIDFLSEDNGKSTLVIGSTRRIHYRLNKISDRLLQLKLENSKLADHRQRALITTRFHSAIDRIIPVQTPQMKNTSIVSIELRQAVPYRVEQTDSLLKVHFEASMIPPKPFEEAGLPSWKKIVDRVTVAEGAAAIAPAEITIADQTPFTVQTQKTYTGEKIALDFFDTDIKNVFRIIKEVSGKNFAIDKNVTGKVTLSLDKPVPWDQVMDLVLKMNQLDMVMEGDIIRIATIATLKKEEDARRAQIASIQKTQEQEKAVKPLMTEYIAVNYSDANEVVKHLQNIASKDRGSISVDARTNQIIFTDVEENIRKAKEIVNHLDKVTPQVVIEARIVEASKTFTRQIGTSWTGSTSVDSHTLGGAYGFDFALNLFDAADPGNLGFNFSRIIGSTLTLDAKLKAMETQQDGKIISSPRIVTLDNKKAIIKQGLEYPYQEKDEDGSISVEFKDIDLVLEVTPHITPDSRINITLKISKNDVAGVVSTGEPFLSTKEAETELLVDNGDTIVIGGIQKSNDTDNQDRIPGVAKIPVLGWLFKYDSKTATAEELLIFITPRIINLEQRTLEVS